MTQTFQVLTYGSRVGEFTTVNGTTIGGDLAFDLTYNLTDHQPSSRLNPGIRHVRLMQGPGYILMSLCNITISV